MDFDAECRPAVQALVARILRRQEQDPDVEDCTHETFRRALESQSKLDPAAPLRPWLLGIARHVALDALRAEYRRRKRYPTADAGPAETLLERQPDLQPSPERQALERQHTERVGRALGELPEQQRQALLLFHVDGKSYREIADELGVPVATVGTWVLRARQGLALVLRSTEAEQQLAKPEGGS